MFTTLNNKLSIICCHIPIQKQVYLHSDRNICIKLIIEFPTGSDKNIKGHVTYLENSILGWGGEGDSSYFPNYQAHHMTAFQFK